MDIPNHNDSDSAGGAHPLPEAVEEDSSQADDAVIGRAVRASLLAVVVLAVIGAAIAWWVHRKPLPPPAHSTALIAPATAAQAVAQIPAARFTDITNAAGIHFIHNNGAFGDKLLPETMGAGVAFLDYDNDGKPDLLLVNGTWWPGHTPPGGHGTPLSLYHNDGGGHFTDVTAGSGLDINFYGTGVAVGDYDNDGLADIFITGVGGCHLFHNAGGGKFTDVTSAAGVGGDLNDWSTGCTFVDVDNDGKLDLFVCNYVRWSADIDRGVGYSLVGVGRAYGPPTNFQGAFCRLYHNDGNGHFTDIAEQAGIHVRNKDTGVPLGKSLAVLPVDLDGDGWIDLVVANDTVQNFVFHNRGDGTFEEIGARCGIAFDSYGNTRGAMGIDAARFRNDGAIGISIGNFANEMLAMYVAQNPRPELTATQAARPGGNDLPLFTDEAISCGVGPPSRLSLKFGVLFFDYDLDGWEDLLVANGHLEQEIHKVQQSQRYEQPAQLYWNGGESGAGLCLVGPEKCGTDLLRPIVGRGSAFADIDGDGDLDIVLTQVNGPPLLLRNDQHAGHHWLRFKLIGTRSNRDAIGAQVLIHAAGKTQWRQVMPTRSYLSQSELPVTFGLGDITRLDSVEVIWPRNERQEVLVTDVRIDGLTVITQSAQDAGHKP